MTSCYGNIFLITGHLCGEFRIRPVTRTIDVLRLNKRLSKQSWCWWSETPSLPFWRHRNVTRKMCIIVTWTTTYSTSISHTDDHKSNYGFRKNCSVQFWPEDQSLWVEQSKYFNVTDIGLMKTQSRNIWSLMFWTTIECLVYTLTHRSRMT